MLSINWWRCVLARIVKVCLLISIPVVILFVVNDKTPAEFSYQRKDISNTIQRHNSTEGDQEEWINLAMDDPRVIKRLVSDFLLPPPELGPRHIYQLAHPETVDPSKGQSEVIRRLLHNKTNGFFIECGALDGETRSNTLYMERFLNWTGLLVEADPLNFAKMRKKNRKAWLSSSCLSKTPYPQKVSFKQSFSVGRISSRKAGSHRHGYVDVQCFPLYSYLLALNVSHVDYFSLDIEGDELDVLWTLPFEKVDIETLSVEFRHVGEGKEALRRFMESNDYVVVAEVTHPGGYANDFIFVKNIPSF